MRPSKTRAAARRNRRVREPFAKRARSSAIRYLKAGLAILALPALVFLGIRVRTEATTAPYLRIEEIEVKGATRVAPEDIIRLSGIKKGENIFSFTASLSEGAVASNEWVAVADVKRHLPGRVSIEVSEREPLAFVLLDSIYVMDTKGVIFKRYGRHDSLDLPLITGLSAGDIGDPSVMEPALTLMAVLRGRGGFNISSASEIHYDRAFGFSVYTVDEGIRLDLGKEDFEAGLVSFERVLNLRGGLKGVEAMDLTNPSSVIVRLSDAEDEALRPVASSNRGREAHGQKG